MWFSFRLNLFLSDNVNAILNLLLENFFVWLVNTIGSTPIVSETNRKYVTDLRATRMPILAVSRLHLIDPSSIEHNSAC